MKLEERYKRTVNWCIGLTALVFVIVLNFVYPWMLELQNNSQDDTAKIILFFLSVGSVYTAFFIVPLKIYETILWKILNRNQNYNGYWLVTVVYTHLERPQLNPKDRLNLPYRFCSVFRIDQSLFDLRFVDGYSAPNETWRDTSMRLSEDGFMMSYQIDRQGKSYQDSIPPCMWGLEKVYVQRRSGLGAPVYLEGHMYHASLPDTALYRGTVSYEKCSRKEYLRFIQEAKKKDRENEPD